MDKLPGSDCKGLKIIIDVVPRCWEKRLRLGEPGLGSLGSTEGLWDPGDSLATNSTERDFGALGTAPGTRPAAEPWRGALC